jgi:hypothetical protein
MKVADKYRFDEPESMQEALARIALLTRNIANVQYQLGDHERKDKRGRRLSPRAYRRWVQSARASLIYKRQEQAYLKQWVKDRRRAIEARQLDIFEPESPDALVQRCRVALRELLDGASLEEAEVGKLYNVLDQYLQHVA